MPDEPVDQPDGDSPLPDRFGAVELVGRSASATVYRAHDLLLDRQVAVKLFRPDPDPLTLRRAEREGRTLARLSHPGLVSIFDSGVHQDRPYLVMQLISGQSLQSRLLAGALPEADAVRVAAALADALAHIHSRSVVHRDVKPANILLDRDDNPYLGDFGIALVAGQARLTSHDEIIGTPAYLAPEQVRGSDVGPAADIYALGLVLLECLTGEVEYSRADKIEAALARLRKPPRIPTGIDRSLAALLTAMTHRRPGRRPTAARCATLLRTALAAATTAPHHATSRPAGRARPAGALVHDGTRSSSPTVPLNGVPQPTTLLSRRPVMITTGLLVALASTSAGLLLMMQPPSAASQRQADSDSGQTTSQPATRQPATSPKAPSSGTRLAPVVPEQPVADSQIGHQVPPIGPGPLANPPASHVPPGQVNKPPGSHQPPGQTKPHH
ncbi:MAG TPA: protein kinase [Pseudonocardiaceae bacterium]|jgi:serine/threonine protein kinase|nr:protein kinase [Pseudonocardiaceae bacterium]